MKADAVGRYQNGKLGGEREIIPGANIIPDADIISDHNSRGAAKFRLLTDVLEDAKHESTRRKRLMLAKYFRACLRASSATIYAGNVLSSGHTVARA